MMSSMRARTLLVCMAVVALGMLMPCAVARAQTGTKVAPPASDSLKRIKAADTTVAPPRMAIRSRAPSRLSPPLSPARAFLYSLVLPGLGQSRLDRGTSGALFATIELAALTMVRRSRAELNEAMRFHVDTLASDFLVTATGLTKTGSFSGSYPSDLIQTRRLHVEDWIATMAFNHLFAGADAFVAAQLWDVPVSVAASPSRDGVTLVASIRW
jgi:hypothetical protein